MSFINLSSHRFLRKRDPTLAPDYRLQDSLVQAVCVSDLAVVLQIQLVHMYCRAVAADKIQDLAASVKESESPGAWTCMTFV